MIGQSIDVIEPSKAAALRFRWFKLDNEFALKFLSRSVDLSSFLLDGLPFRIFIMLNDELMLLFFELLTGIISDGNLYLLAIELLRCDCSIQCHRITDLFFPHPRYISIGCNRIGDLFFSSARYSNIPQIRNRRWKCNRWRYVIHWTTIVQVMQII